MLKTVSPSGQSQAWKCHCTYANCCIYIIYYGRITAYMCHFPLQKHIRMNKFITSIVGTKISLNGVNVGPDSHCLKNAFCNFYVEASENTVICQWAYLVGVDGFVFWNRNARKLLILKAHRRAVADNCSLKRTRYTRTGIITRTGSEKRVMVGERFLTKKPRQTARSN